MLLKQYSYLMIVVSTFIMLSARGHSEEEKPLLQKESVAHCNGNRLTKGFGGFCAAGLTMVLLMDHTKVKPRSCFTVSGTADGKQIVMSCISAPNKTALEHTFTEHCANASVTVSGTDACSLCYDASPNSLPCLSPKQAREQAKVRVRLANKFQRHFNKTKTNQLPKTKPQHFKKPHR